MNLRFFQELMDLNLAFEQVIHGLQRSEKVRLFNGEIIRYARADVESARVDANREFFDNFDDIVENDAVWANKFQRDYNKKIKDPDDIYLEIKDSEERRRRKRGLPQRLVVLPGWDISDEERCDEEQAKKRKRIKNKCQKTSRRRSNHSKPSMRVTAAPQTKSASAAERDANNGET